LDWRSSSLVVGFPTVSHITEESREHFRWHLVERECVTLLI
jgi:hypothetical protein